MRFDVKVTNLGKLKEGNVKVRPITVLTGPNGTGKSFFTKTLYSVFNVINKNVHHESLVKSIRLINLRLDGIIENISYSSEHDSISIKYIIDGLNGVLEQIKVATDGDIEEYLDFTKSRVSVVAELENNFDLYVKDLQLKAKKYESVKRQITSIKRSFKDLKSNFSNSLEHYNTSIASSLHSEISDNFQVSDLGELVSFGEEKSHIIVDDLIDIELGSKGVGFSLGRDFINEVSSLSRVVFFESPAYWKVRDALKSARERSLYPFFTRRDLERQLTGVPKYFYDLEEALRLEHNKASVEDIEDLTELIKGRLGGEFIFNGDKLIYKDSHSGKEISKNLISFGMTNLGMIHSLLKNNVITPGSFVFIDEPETNLHPKWQVLLMNVLVSLAKLNVNIVIATHSIDMLKALEVGLENTELEDDFMSVHYFDTDGELLDFESDVPRKQLIEARSELNAPYSELYFKGCTICD
ncbi:AAA family ATPase [Photobacterium damselae]|uniref:AAA family ATPase n=1 Tax=Photobacterium damselae TaxID=38293 RepID=UPI00130264B2|nr:AAA family ATPase [Photobacterium damselae]